ncbi:MAG: hypothetical protein H6Q91_1323 [Deltaproteobacteria bacterium]|nr:hypothetical protein [Deltaproteobacteria bacterium]
MRTERFAAFARESIRQKRQREQTSPERVTKNPRRSAESTRVLVTAGGQ